MIKLSYSDLPTSQTGVTVFESLRSPTEWEKVILDSSLVDYLHKLIFDQGKLSSVTSLLAGVRCTCNGSSSSVRELDLRAVHWLLLSISKSDEIERKLL